MADLVAVLEFGDPIFPSLVPMDRVQNGPADAPWHTLIEADNYHALQLLEYLYAGQVDCIYIDPPYNTGGGTGNTTTITWIAMTAGGTASGWR